MFHVKPADDLKIRIIELCASGGVIVREDVAAQILSYLRAILLANRSLNLTRIADDSSAVRLHIVDSLMAIPEVDAAPDGRLLDMGSGGGFPGVPLAVASGRRSVLLDSTEKKMKAVAAALVECRLGSEVDVVTARAEEYALREPGAFAVVTARAVAPLAALVELAAPLLRENGVLIALKGAPDSRERADGSATARVVGLREIGWREFQLPGGAEKRTIVSYRRTGNPKVRLPRRVGLAQHSPLA